MKDLLKDIRKNPEKYMMKDREGKLEKKIHYLLYFLKGYGRKWRIETWEKETGLEYYEHFDAERYNSIPKPPGYREHVYGGLNSEFISFCYYVHIHYDLMLQTRNTDGSEGRPCPRYSIDGISLIRKMTNSEEEAFDKFVELYSEFLEIVDNPEEYRKFINQFLPPESRI